MGEKFTLKGGSLEDGALSKIKHVIGVDPGRDGGYVILKNCSSPDSMEVYIYRMARHISDAHLSDFLKQVDPKETLVVFESVHAFPGGSISAAFNFGKVVGYMKASLLFHGFQFIEVQPHIWQFKFIKPVDCKKERKEALYSRAKNLFFDKVTLHKDIADAALIAIYGYYKLPFEI